MGWEQRRGGRYYYHKERVAGRVVSRYLGVGPIAEALADLDQAERVERAVRREEEREERRRADEIDTALDAMTERAAMLTAVALLAAGCHTHKGQWRRRRYAAQDDAGDSAQD